MKNNLSFISVIIACSFLMTSCNKIPKDLKEKKDLWNDRYNILSQKAESINNNDETKKLIVEFQKLKQDAAVIIDEFNKRGVNEINKNVINDVNEKIKSLTETLPTSITYAEAKAFMQNRCNELGQNLMKSKTVNFNGIKLYLFLSVAENGYVCVSSISENTLEILAADCGPADIKIEEWNAIN